MHCADRTSSIGKLINEYLTNTREMDDHVLHLLFAANRWEHAYSTLHPLCYVFVDSWSTFTGRWRFPSLALLARVASGSRPGRVRVLCCHLSFVRTP